ncbi:MAG: DUF2442 domain-containing protein [Acidobacteria bacterium]|nr:DUF2442 domain-containing protein [Acidobacteriota bacterium]HMM78701.1 DUF2442 domain-containing protein [Pyrinomonadaceae bacterium]
MELVRVNKVKALHDFVVYVWFSDGSEREIDIGKYLHGPVFERVRTDPKLFSSVKVTAGRTIGWGDDLDIDPDTLFYDLVPAWMEKHELELSR